jgi:biotin carboxyl carrier protein
VGETFSGPERIIVAPATGTFHLLEGPAGVRDGAVINRGDVIGTVQSLVTSTPIESPFEGLLVTILALEGERLRPGQPVAWLRMQP